MSKETLSTVFVSDQRSPEKWALPPPPSLEGGDSDTNLSATSNDDGESNYVNDAHDFVLSGSHAISGSELNLTSSDEDSAYNKDGIEDGHSALLMDSVLISRTLASDTPRAPELVGGGFLDEAPPPPPDSSDSDDSDEDGEYVDVGFETA